MVSVGKYTIHESYGLWDGETNSKVAPEDRPKLPKRKREKCHPVPSIFQVANLRASFQGRFFPVNTWRGLRVLETLGLFFFVWGDVKWLATCFFKHLFSCLVLLNSYGESRLSLWRSIFVHISLRSTQIHK